MKMGCSDDGMSPCGVLEGRAHFKAGHMPFTPSFDCTGVAARWNVVAAITAEMTAYASSTSSQMHPAISAGDLIWKSTLMKTTRERVIRYERYEDHISERPYPPPRPEYGLTELSSRGLIATAGPDNDTCINNEKACGAYGHVYIFQYAW